MVERLAEWGDLLDLPENARAEILSGRIESLPPPLPEHGRVQRSLGHFIGGPFDDDDGAGGPGGWWILIEVELRLSRHQIVRPDLAGWRRQRLRDPWGKRPLDTGPDWICEILSPSNEDRDRVTKADLYADSGLPHYWIVDPHERIVEAFQLEHDRWLRLGAWDPGKHARIPPFDAIELDIARLFPPRASTTP